MISKIKYMIVMIILSIGTISVRAQDYDYVLAYSNHEYSAMTDTAYAITTIADPEDVNELPIGFSFTFAGLAVDSVSLKNTGLLRFDTDNRYNFSFLNKEFVTQHENESYPSSVSYRVSLDTINRQIMQIEFKNLLLVRGEENIYFNFQVWLCQYTNVIEFHMGPVYGSMPSENCIMGLINMDNTDVASVGYLLQGTPASPTGSLIPAQGSLTELTAIPAQGTVYKFTPSFN